MCPLWQKTGESWKAQLDGNDQNKCTRHSARGQGGLFRNFPKIRKTPFVARTKYQNQIYRVPCTEPLRVTAMFGTRHAAKADFSGISLKSGKLPSWREPSTMPTKYQCEEHNSATVPHWHVPTTPKNTNSQEPYVTRNNIGSTDRSPRPNWSKKSFWLNWPASKTQLKQEPIFG